MIIATLPFWKIQSIGNDFPLIHLDDVEEEQLPQLAIEMCERRFGVGGDGLLAVRPLGIDEVLLRMFNPDGTEDFCGNGLRCAALHASSQGWVSDRSTFSHLGRQVRIEIDGERIITHLGKASYDPKCVPLEGRSEPLIEDVVFSAGSEVVVGSALTTGSTHTIIPVPGLPEDSEFSRLGPLIEHYRLFPKRTSVVWREAIEPMRLGIRIWERGVGETLGCGTGSSAAAVDYLRGLGTGGRVQVDNRGGTVFVSADSWDGEILLEGTARMVFDGTYQLREQ